MNYYISDLHFGHANVIKFDPRPFQSLKEMHQTIINNWNAVITPEDDVYILGDFAWKEQIGIEIISQLVGRKYLIKGNHDKPTEELTAYFEWVKDYAMIRDCNSKVVLCHYPIAHWNHQYRNSVHLYGHVHNTQDYELFQQYGNLCREKNIPFLAYNVGCMMPYMDYTPRTLQQIISNQ